MRWLIQRLLRSVLDESLTSGSTQEGAVPVAILCNQ